MTEQTLIQFRADKKLKEEVSAIYESIGMDLPTAFRMFLVRSKITKGLPFPATLQENYVTREKALEAFETLRMQASNVPEMSLDEINEEISKARTKKES